MTEGTHFGYGLQLDDAASLLSLEPEALAKAASAGEVPARYFENEGWRFSRDALEGMIENHFMRFMERDRSRRRWPLSLLCRIGLHHWSPWSTHAVEYPTRYLDYEDERHCKRCSRSDSYYYLWSEIHNARHYRLRSDDEAQR